MKHYSKVSLPLVLSISTLQLAPVFLYINEGFSTAAVIVYATMISFTVFFLHMMYNTTYTIEGQTLHIKVGFFNFPSVDILDMKEITRTNTWLSSPASSFDRIAIKHGRYKKLIISPKDKHLLAAQLQQINPEIVIKLDQSGK